MKKVWPKILVAMVIMLALVVIPATATAISPPTLILENKNWDTGWSVEADGISGILQYNLSGTTFDFSVTATGLANGDYSLIYYADKPDEFHYWGGDNPGAVIWHGASSLGSLNSGSQSVPLNMNLPEEPDYNIIKDYCGVPDFYTTCHGAKIWLIPSSALTGDTSLPVTAWPPNDNWLFETNLITYQYLPSGSVGLGVTVLPASIGMTVTPYQLDFGSVAQGACSTPDRVITLSNGGGVPIRVTASTSAGFYTDCLKIENVVANGWISPIIAVGEHLDINAKVCPTIAYSGTITGSVSFVASFAP